LTPGHSTIEKFAERATIYHNHYSTGVFTVPGASSLLTGLYPWSHRAFQIGAGISPQHVSHSIFAAVAPTHSTLAYTQNKLADQILYQVESDLNQHVKASLFDVEEASLYSAPSFQKDPRVSFASIDDNLVQLEAGFDSSLFFGPLYRLHIMRDRQRIKRQYGAGYPRGLPQTPAYFLMEDIVQGAIGLLKQIQEPTLAYLHFWSPHGPYAPSQDFFEKFLDGWNAPEKPVHELSSEKTRPEKLRQHRRYYDEYIANWDAEIARLFQFLKESRLTENSYIIITADHGEMFERGELGHGTKLLYDPVIHVPLIVLSPGQTQREDVYAATSSVDLLSTIAHLTGNSPPAWAEGKLLPKLGGVEDKARSIFSMDAKTNSSFGPLENFSSSITRDYHRLTAYTYPSLNYQKYEFYDLQTDPHELNNLYLSGPALALEMKDELLQKIEEVNGPYRRSKE
jgi:arylsulfatase A-like enzyme